MVGSPCLGGRLRSDPKVSGITLIRGPFKGSETKHVSTTDSRVDLFLSCPVPVWVHRDVPREPSVQGFLRGDLSF